MEGKKEVGSSSSSLFNDFFGPKDPLAPKGYFESILGPPPTKVPGREALRAEGKGHGSANDAGNKISGDGNSKRSRGEGNSKKTWDISSGFQKQHVHPCNLSSSIYYGGPDDIPYPSNSQGPGSNSLYGQDDYGAATRGDWWQGSAFY